jgi:hypothetical protein
LEKKEASRKIFLPNEKKSEGGKMSFSRFCFAKHFFFTKEKYCQAFTRFFLAIFPTLNRLSQS